MSLDDCHEKIFLKQLEHRPVCLHNHRSNLRKWFEAFSMHLKFLMSLIQVTSPSVLLTSLCQVRREKSSLYMYL